MVIKNPGLTKKQDLGPNIMVFQNRLYKGRDKFYKEVKQIPIRYTTKSSLVRKIKQAIDYKIPTVACGLFDYAKNFNEEGVIDIDLQETNLICKNASTDPVFLRSAFGEPENTKIEQLGELYYYLYKIKESKENITEIILNRFGEIEDLKYSDFLNLGMVLKNQKGYIDDIRTQLDTFSGVVIYKYLLGYAEKIHQSGEFPEDFSEQFKKRFEYFSEGIRKWAFIDRNVKPDIKKDIRRLSLRSDYKDIVIAGNEIMLAKLFDLYDYVSVCYLNLMSDDGYQFYF